MVAGYANRDRIRLKIASVYVSVPPKSSQTAPPSKRAHSSVFGDAPWALSALPECFDQMSKTTGPAAYVLAHLPKNLPMARPGERLTYADCTLRIAGDAVLVARGTDRLRIPPPSRIYAGRGTVALLRGLPGGYELRVYETK